MNSREEVIYLAVEQAKRWGANLGGGSCESIEEKSDIPFWVWGLGPQENLEV